MALVKVCGNRYAMDAHLVASFEPDYMGWIFVPSSPRRISPDQAMGLIRAIRGAHPSIQHVAVMGGTGLDEIIRLLRQMKNLTAPENPVDAIQLIGTALDVECIGSILRQMGLKIPIWPVLRVDSAVSDQDLLNLGHAKLYLLDRKMPNALGGTGRVIEEEWIQNVTLPYLLAGGINPQNAREKLERTSAAGLDIGSGLETGIPGRKDEAKLEELFRSLGRV
tara:strand:- start:49661 stop:50326 length:666 start_codon:yes stop_codon:yes gene_type:complete